MSWGEEQRKVLFRLGLPCQNYAVVEFQAVAITQHDGAVPSPQIAAIPECSIAREILGENKGLGRGFFIVTNGVQLQMCARHGRVVERPVAASVSPTAAGTQKRRTNSVGICRQEASR